MKIEALTTRSRVSFLDLDLDLGFSDDDGFAIWTPFLAVAASNKTTQFPVYFDFKVGFGNKTNKLGSLLGIIQVGYSLSLRLGSKHYAQPRFSKSDRIEGQKTTRFPVYFDFKVGLGNKTNKLGSLLGIIQVGYSLSLRLGPKQEVDNKCLFMYVNSTRSQFLKVGSNR
ncbi:hypothetical protein Dimus_023246 [Dionaea muscipula]